MQAKAALASGMSVVIGLQSTGEAAADAMGVEPGPLPGFVSPCKELLVRFIQQHFPIHHPQAPEGRQVTLWEVCFCMQNVGRTHVSSHHEQSADSCSTHHPSIARYSV